MRDIPPTRCVSPVGRKRKVCGDKIKYVKSKVNNPRLFFTARGSCEGDQLLAPCSSTCHESRVSCGLQ
jgi:hypothetical protein